MITFNEQNKIFTIHTKNSTYQMKVDKYGFLLHLYYGGRTEGNMDYLLVCLDRGFSGNPYDAGNDRAYSLDVLPQEFPCRGNGDFRSPAIDVRYENGSYGCDLRYEKHFIKKGKYSIEGLPAVYADEALGETLEIVLLDKTCGMEVRLLYGVLPELDIITRSVKVKNSGSEKIYIEKLQSACLDFVSGEYDLITFYGRHAMERNMQRIRVSHTSQQIGSRRGMSSHQYNPLMLLAEKAANEDSGSCYAMSLVYSGSFLGEAECDSVNQTRIQLGLSDEQFSYPLAEGEFIYAPEVIISYSGNGLSSLSGNLHKCIRKHICRGKYRDGLRPLLVNSWEAAYFNFNGETIVKLAEEAAELGVDMLVMDDGWFGKRDDDNSGLGDWYVNEKKLGCTLNELITRVNNKGLKFGIWIEPEMVNEDSDLYREHSDWALSFPNRKPVRARNQLVLDFSRKDVVDYIYDQICSVLNQGNIEYVKWDFNRSISDVFSHGDKHQGKVMYDYILGLYDFLERLNNSYPDILIEGCSGGGGRFDAGMLYYTPQIWCSDNTDAVDRTRIQYGTSFGYPVCASASHVSAAPNHQTSRSTPLHTRGVVAMAGSFGYELDFGKMSCEEKNEVKNQIKAYRRYEKLIHEGDYYRLSNPFEDMVAAWEIVSEDKSRVLTSAVLLEIHGNMPVIYIKFKGLCPDAFYRNEEDGMVYSGAALMEAGIPIVSDMKEYQAWQFYFEKV